MGRPERAKRAIAGLLGGRRARLNLSEDTRVRIGATVLWVLVALGALGGLVALTRPAHAPRREEARTGSPSSTVSEAWAAAGFGARAIASYLGADGRVDGDGAFAGFVGDSRAADRSPAGDAPAVAVVAVDRAGERYWAVTVVARSSGREEFWRVGVASRHGRLVATGLPTPVAAPSVAEQPELAVASSPMPPGDDPAVETVTGWVGAYACGQGDVSPWLAPGVHLAAVTPPLCAEVRLERWGSQPRGDNGLLVVTEAALDPGASERRVAFALSLARRDGRWEVAELLPAPPPSEEVDE